MRPVYHPRQKLKKLLYRPQEVRMIAQLLLSVMMSQTHYNTVTVGSAKVGSHEYRLYSSSATDIFWTSERPAEHCAFAVPGTFTAPDGRIDGCHVIGGSIGRRECNGWDGLAIFGKYQPLYIFNQRRAEMSLPRDLDRFSKREIDVFEAFLLVSENMPQKFSAPTKATRRALTEDSFVIESLDDLTLQEFADDLFEMEVHDAINLDMGPPGLGWYRDAQNKKIMIGTRAGRTLGITNWLTFGDAKSKTCAKAMSPMRHLSSEGSQHADPFMNL